jgi:hypothetical protein
MQHCGDQFIQMGRVGHSIFSRTYLVGLPGSNQQSACGPREFRQSSTNTLKLNHNVFNDWLCFYLMREMGFRWMMITSGPRPKKRGQAPGGAARKGRAYLTGKRFVISKVIMIFSATGRRRGAGIQGSDAIEPMTFRL